MHPHRSVLSSYLSPSSIPTVWPHPSQHPVLTGRRATSFSILIGQYHLLSCRDFSSSFQSLGRLIMTSARLRVSSASSGMSISWAPIPIVTSVK